MDKQGFGIQEIWNASLEVRKSKEPRTRNNLWASELGKSPIDLFLKMTGVPESNPADARALRKFEAGNVFEWIMGLILKRAGILKEQQKWCSYQYPGLLQVTGKSDFIAGGTPDYEKWQAELTTLGLPEVFIRASQAVMEYLKMNHPNGLKEMPLEIKSCSSFIFEAMQRSQKSNKNHRMQLFHYLKADNWTEGNLIYICRDDLRIMEFSLFNPSEAENEYKDQLAILSQALSSGQKPPLEPLLVFDEDLGRFSKNWRVEYSSYLTMLYGFTHQEAYATIYRPMAERFNRVINRLIAGSKMTPKNAVILEEMQKMGFDPQVYAAKAQAIRGVEEETEEPKL